MPVLVTASYRVCADGGATRVVQHPDYGPYVVLSVVMTTRAWAAPDVLIGDMDSVDRGSVQHFTQRVCSAFHMCHMTRVVVCSVNENKTLMIWRSAYDIYVMIVML